MDSKEKRFKQTEIGVIPKDWEAKKLIQVAEKDSDIVAGPFGSNLKVEDYRDEGFPIIRLQNIERYNFIDNDIKFTTREKYEELKYHSFNAGDIVLAKLGIPIGKTCIVPDEMSEGIVVADVVRFGISNKRINKYFLMYVLNSNNIKNQLYSRQLGTTRPRVNLSDVRDLLIPFPPIEEQNAIAKILADLDFKIKLCQRMNKTLEGIGQAVFKRWFVDFEFPNHEGKPYKSSGGEMVHNSALEKEIPAKWAVKEIGELAKINELSIKGDFKYSKIEYVDIDSVNQGVIRNPQVLQLVDAPSRAKRIVRNKDIIISTVRPNLKHFAFIQKAKPNTIVSTGFAVISPNKGNSKFLYYHLTSDKYTNYLSAIADSHTSTYPSFNPDIIQKSVVAYPSGNEQVLTSRFDLILEALFCKIENNSKQISALSQLRDMLLPKLMSGKIRVPLSKEKVETVSNA